MPRLNIENWAIASKLTGPPNVRRLLDSNQRRARPPQAKKDIHSLSTGHRFGGHRLGDMNRPLIDSTDSPFCNFGSRYQKPACGRKNFDFPLRKAWFDQGCRRN
jgi:hypothetical protein